MATPYTQQEIRRLIGLFDVYGDFLVGTPFGNGNVNDTFQLTFDQGGVRLHYILQRINSNIFKQPVKVIVNATKVANAAMNDFLMIFKFFIIFLFSNYYKP